MARDRLCLVQIADAALTNVLLHPIARGQPARPRLGSSLMENRGNRERCSTFPASMWLRPGEGLGIGREPLFLHARWASRWPHLQLRHGLKEVVQELGWVVELRQQAQSK